ncbi:MAG: DUF1819 family protein, partial [Bacteroidetes bacterium]|nr:DUF1819 family protein [Bacteroidota bacterium]
KYRLSFTGASLMLAEMSELARWYLEHGRESVDKQAIIKGQKTKTIVTQFREVKLRVDSLTQPQLELLAYGDQVAQKQVALLSVCKVYSFIRDFLVEVVREKALVFNFQITDGEYLTFFRRKQELHPELNEVTENTNAKIRQVLFKILVQTNLIDSVRSKQITPPILDPKVARSVVAEDPEWLKVYLLSDQDMLTRTR